MLTVSALTLVVAKLEIDSSVRLAENDGFDGGSRQDVETASEKGGFVEEEPLEFGDYVRL